MEKESSNNKVERLLKMHEQAELLSDEDIQSVLGSADNEADLNTLSAIKRAMATKRADLSDDDIDGYWQSFAAEHLTQYQRNGGSAHWSWMKIAAMFVGVMMIAGVAFAAIRVLVGRYQEASLKAEKPLTANEQDPVSAVNTVVLTDSMPSATTGNTNVVRYDDVELQDILTDMAAHYRLTLHYENEQSKHIKIFFKWNKRTDVASVVDVLSSYDRISIERKGNVLIIK